MKSLHPSFPRCYCMSSCTSLSPGLVLSDSIIGVYVYGLPPQGKCVPVCSLRTMSCMCKQCSPSHCRLCAYVRAHTFNM